MATFISRTFDFTATLQTPFSALLVERAEDTQPPSIPVTFFVSWSKKSPDQVCMIFDQDPSGFIMAPEFAILPVYDLLDTRFFWISPSHARILRRYIEQHSQLITARKKRDPPSLRAARVASLFTSQVKRKTSEALYGDLSENANRKRLDLDTYVRQVDMSMHENEELEPQGLTSLLIKINDAYDRVVGSDETDIVTSTLKFVEATRKVVSTWLKTIYKIVCSIVETIKDTMTRWSITLHYVCRSFLGFMKTRYSEMRGLLKYLFGDSKSDEFIAEIRTLATVEEDDAGKYKAPCPFVSLLSATVRYDTFSLVPQTVLERLNTAQIVALNEFYAIKANCSNWPHYIRGNAKYLKVKYNAIMYENHQDDLVAQGEDEDLHWTVRYPEKAAQFVSETASALIGSLSGFDGFPSISMSNFKYQFMTLFNVFSVFQRINFVDNASWFADSIYYCLTGKNYFIKYSLLSQWKETTIKLSDLLCQVENIRSPAAIIRRQVTVEFDKMKMIYIPLIEAFKRDANVYRTTYENLERRAAVWLSPISGTAKRAHKPVAIRFEGEAGTGKSSAESSLHANLFKQVLKLLPKLPDGPIRKLLQEMADNPTVYSMSCVVPKKEFDDGYAGQNFASLQELGTITDTTEVAAWMSHYFELIDDQNLCLNTAFGDKGKRFFTSPVVTATTNGQLYTNNLKDPAALYRRIEFDLETKRVGKPDEIYDINLHTRFKMTTTNIICLLSRNTPSRILTRLYTTGYLQGWFDIGRLIKAVALVYLERISVPSTTSAANLTPEFDPEDPLSNFGYDSDDDEPKEIRADCFSFSEGKNEFSHEKKSGEQEEDEDVGYIQRCLNRTLARFQPEKIEIPPSVQVLLEIEEKVKNLGSKKVPSATYRFFTIDHSSHDDKLYFYATVAKHDSQYVAKLVNEVKKRDDVTELYERLQTAFSKEEDDREFVPKSESVSLTEMSRETEQKLVRDVKVATKTLNPFLDLMVEERAGVRKGKKDDEGKESKGSNPFEPVGKGKGLEGPSPFPDPEPEPVIQNDSLSELDRETTEGQGRKENEVKAQKFHEMAFTYFSVRVPSALESPGQFYAVVSDLQDALGKDGLTELMNDFRKSNFSENLGMHQFFRSYADFVRWRPAIAKAMQDIPLSRAECTKAQKAYVHRALFDSIGALQTTWFYYEKFTPIYKKYSEWDTLQMWTAIWPALSPMSKKQVRYMAKKEGKVISDRGNMTPVSSADAAKYKVRQHANRVRNNTKPPLTPAQKQAKLDAKRKAFNDSKEHHVRAKGKKREEIRNQQRSVKWDDRLGGDDDWYGEVDDMEAQVCSQVPSHFQAVADSYKEFVDAYKDEAYSTWSWATTFTSSIVEKIFEHVDDDSNIMGTVIFTCMYQMGVRKLNRSKADHIKLVWAFLFAGGISDMVQQRDLSAKIIGWASREAHAVEILKEVIHMRLKDQPLEAKDMEDHVIGGIPFSAEADGYSAEFMNIRAMYSVMSTGLTVQKPPESIFVVALRFIAAAVAGATLGAAVGMLIGFVARKLGGVDEKEKAQLTLTREEYFRFFDYHKEKGYTIHISRDSDGEPFWLELERASYRANLQDSMEAQSVDPAASKTRKGLNLAQIANERMEKQVGTVSTALDILKKSFFMILSLSGDLIGHMTFVGGRIALTNKHVFESIMYRKVQFVPSVNCGLKGFYATITQQTPRFDHPNNDAVLFTLDESNNGAMRLIKKHFSPLDATRKHKQTITNTGAILFTNQGNACVDIVGDMNYVVRNEPLFPDGELSADCLGYVWPANRQSMCGSLLLVKNSATGTYQIEAIHAAGSQSSGYCRAVPLSREWIQEGISYFENMTPCSAVFESPLDVHLATVTQKQCAGWDLTENCSVSQNHGLKRTVATDKTTFQPSLFHEHKMRGWDRTAPCHMTEVAFEKTELKEAKRTICSDPDPEAWRIIRTYAKEMAQYILHRSPSQMAGCRRLTFDEAWDGFGGLGPINYHTSDGFYLPAMGIKKEDISWVGDKPPDATKRDRVRKFCESRVDPELDEFPHMIGFKKCKDEPLEIEFVEADKVRVFKCIDALDVATQRMAVGDYLSRTGSSFLVGPQSCGINPRSAMWGSIANDFKKKLLAESDVGGFDFGVFSLFFPVLNWIARICYPKKKDRLFFCWAFVGCLSSIIYNKGVGIMKGMSNTSGNLNTTELNTIMNIVYFLTAAIFLAEKNGVDPMGVFADFIAWIYSDDNLTAFRSQFSWWNIHNIASVFQHLFHVELTAADKSDIMMAKLVPVEQAQFLSRGFRLEGGIWFAPLVESSLYQRLFWIRVPKRERANKKFKLAQLQQNLDGFMDELYEYSIEDGDRMAQEVDDFIAEHNLPLVVNYDYRDDRVLRRLRC